MPLIRVLIVSQQVCVLEWLCHLYSLEDWMLFDQLSAGVTVYVIHYSSDCIKYHSSSKPVDHRWQFLR